MGSVPRLSQASSNSQEGSIKAHILFSVVTLSHPRPAFHSFALYRLQSRPLRLTPCSIFITAEMKSVVVLALASAALSAPTRTVENRGLPGLGSGTESGLDALKSLIPDHSGTFSDLPSLPHFSGLPDPPALTDLPGLSGSGDSGNLPSLPTGLPGLSDLVSPPKEEATKTEKRQLGTLISLIPQSLKLSFEFG